MKVNEKFKVQFLQEGGQMPAGEAQPAPEAQGGGAPQGEPTIDQILQVATQALQNEDCQAGFAVCAALVQMAQAQGGGQGAAPAPAEPTVMKKGGKIMVVKRG